jgi:hypothetical protein
MSKVKVIRRAGWVHNCKTDEDVLFGMDVETTCELIQVVGCWLDKENYNTKVLGKPG